MSERERQPGGQEPAGWPPLAAGLGGEDGRRGEARPRSPGWIAWRRFRRDGPAVLGLGLLVALVAAMTLGPLLYRTDPAAIDIMAASQGPSAAHPFGTDDLGRDLLARTLAGGRISLAVGLAAMLVAVSVGTAIGLVAGYVRRLDGVLMRFTDLMLTLPQIPLLLVVMGFFREPLRLRLGPELGPFLITVTVIGLLGWMQTARLVRSSTLELKQREFVKAAVSIGAPTAAILRRHLLPNVAGLITVAATLAVAAAILTESTLSFLGVGFPPETPTWGSLLYAGRNYMTQYPWLVLFPGGLIALTILAVNLMGDGLRDALDPEG